MKPTTENSDVRRKFWTAYVVILILGVMAIAHVVRDTVDPRMPAQYCPAK